MGAGDFCAGEGDAGEDPVSDASPAVNNTPPAAAYLDLATKNFRLNEDGSTAEMHPVDQAAQWSFLNRQGTLHADTRVGHTFFQAPPLTGEAKLNDLRRRAREAFPFSKLIAQRDVEFIDVVLADPKKGETGIAVLYRNLRLDPTKTQTATAF